MPDQNIRFQCDCGVELQTESADARVSCECGRIYVVTLSLIASAETAPTTTPIERP